MKKEALTVTGKARKIFSTVSLTPASNSYTDWALSHALFQIILIGKVSKMLLLCSNVYPRLKRKTILESMMYAKVKLCLCHLMSTLLLSCWVTDFCLMRRLWLRRKKLKMRRRQFCLWTPFQNGTCHLRHVSRDWSFPSFAGVAKKHDLAQNWNNWVFSPVSISFENRSYRVLNKQFQQFFVQDLVKFCL
jgi:hypothetical protein